jgi:hypothetical protein
VGRQLGNAKIAEGRCVDDGIGQRRSWSDREWRGAGTFREMYENVERRDKRTRKESRNRNSPVTEALALSARLNKNKIVVTRRVIVRSGETAESRKNRRIDTRLRAQLEQE